MPDKTDVETTTLLALFTPEQWGPFAVALEVAGALWASLTLPGGIIAVVPCWQELPPLPPRARWFEFVPFGRAVEVMQRFKDRHPSAVVRGADVLEQKAGISNQRADRSE